MRRSFLFALLITLAGLVQAQKNDYIWLQGYGSSIGFDTSWGFYFANPKMDFNYSPVKITRDSLQMNFDWTNTSFCDSNGSLLFYTNGASIANANNEIIEKSDSLNWGYWMENDDPQHGSEGYLIKEGIYALRSLTNSNQYYIIHCLIDTNAESGGAILFTLLDMSLNQGRGEVIYINHPLLIDKVGLSFTLTRHGNGRDWWIIVQKKSTNCYYRILLDESGPHLLPDSTCGGATFAINDFGPMNFSQDGNKLFSLGVYAGLNIFDFNRCTGEISNPIHIPYPFLSDSNWTSGGLATSPSSRYLYVCLQYYLFQYDLWDSDIANSLDTVGVFDGFNGPFQTDFYTAQNGPDGKIYISCGNADTVYHVINNPDAKGDSCGLVQHGIHLSSPSWGVPSFPNYRLGVLLGEACDTLTGLNEIQRDAKEKILKVFPNPATDYATIDYGFTDWNKGPISLEISDALGQIIYTQPLPMYSGFQKLNVAQFAAGIYNVTIKRSAATIAATKLVKQ